MCNNSVPNRELLMSRIIDSVCFKIELLKSLINIDICYKFIKKRAEKEKIDMDVAVIMTAQEMLKDPDFRNTCKKTMIEDEDFLQSVFNDLYE